MDKKVWKKAFEVFGDLLYMYKLSLQFYGYKATFKGKTHSLNGNAEKVDIFLISLIAIFLPDEVVLIQK